MAKILSVGPDPTVLAPRNRELRLYGHLVRSAENRAEVMALAKTGIFDIILLCNQFLPAYAAQLADELCLVAPATRILVLAGRSTPLTADEIHALVRKELSSSRAA